MTTPLISPEQLLLFKGQPDLILVDARSGPEARKNYEAGHLQGALFVDLEQDLSEKSSDPSKGGRHPLPAPEKFALVLQRLGISSYSQVIIYDDKNGANAAARFWWMLKAAGHDKVQVVDGGMAAAIAAGFPVDSVIPKPEKSSYQIEKWLRPTVTMDEVELAGQNPNWLVIDVRDDYRYRGESEPLDPAAGHIPGAVNIPLTGNLAQNRRFLPPEELASKYKEVIGDRPVEHVIVHCGSGVTACHTLLALEQAGAYGSKLYPGSWSEWCRSGRPMKTGADPI